MPRQARISIDYPGGLYHTINRGVNRQIIFFHDEDYILFLHCLRKTQETYPFKLFSFCLMPNHFHLLIQTLEISVSKILSSVLTRFAQMINKRNNRTGHLFQGRTKTILCEREKHLLALTRYIPLNPIRAKLVVKPEDWPWSSFRLFLGLKIPHIKQLPRLELEELLSYYERNYQKAFDHFQDFLEAGIKEGHRGDLYPKSRLPILGSKNFIQSVLEKTNLEPQRKTVFPGKIRIPLEKLVELVTVRNGVPLEQLRQKTQERKATQTRALIAYLASRCANITLSKVAHYLGVTGASLSKSTARLQKNLQNNPSPLNDWIRLLGNKSVHLS